MRGRSCPKAWVFPVPERVCPKVLSTSSKSLASRVGTRKSRHASKNLPAFRRESLRSGEGRGLDALSPATGAVEWRYPTPDPVAVSGVAHGLLSGVLSHVNSQTGEQ